MGVAVGLGLAVAVTVGEAVTVGDAVTVGVAVTELVVVGEAVAVCDLLGVAGAPDVLPADEGTVAVPLATAVGADAVVAVPTDGEKIDGTEDEPPPLQADTDPESRRVPAAQPAAVSLALLTFIRPPCLPG
jgi:hypothetical protein